MKASDIVAQIARVFPRHASNITTDFTVSTLTRSGTTVTATTTATHGLTVGGQANIVGAQTPLTIGSLTRADTLGTLVTDNDHDLTEGFKDSVVLQGAAEVEFNGTFTIVAVLNRKTITFVMPDAGPMVATGSPLLINGASDLKQYNGLHNITAIPSTLQFRFEITDVTLFTPAAGTIIARTNPRVSAAVTEEKLISAYTKQPAGSFWLFVVLGDVFASKNRNVLSDATDNQQRGDQFRQQVIQPFTVYAFFPTSAEIAGRIARDDAEDLFRPLCQSLLSVPFDSGLAVGKQGNTQFVTHGFAADGGAYYAHAYGFEQVVDITFEDTIGYSVDVAFRDVSVNMGVDIGTGVLTADIDLDTEPL